MFDSSSFVKIPNYEPIDKTDGFTQTENFMSNSKPSNFFHHCSGTGRGDNCCSPLRTNLASAVTNSFNSLDCNNFSPTHSRHQVNFITLQFMQQIFFLILG